MPRIDTKILKKQAIAHTFLRAENIAGAVDQLSFVQADPIRSPARAQDLILRQRVPQYRAGDLEAQFDQLNIEEDFFYAYGFMPQVTYELLHPRSLATLSKFDRQVLEVVKEIRNAHPKALEAHFGRKKVVNAWGGFSKETTRSLDRLQYHGHLRVSRRERGIRVYDVAKEILVQRTEDERLRELTKRLVHVFAPMPERKLRRLLMVVRKPFAPKANIVQLIQSLVTAGELEKSVVDDISYVSPPRQTVAESDTERVRVLAPFDPLVWDRERFEHLWGWAYRFEAYTPPKKRVRGYYAMPLLWRDDVVGWANVSSVANGLDFDFGFVKKRPTDKAFRGELDKEIERFRDFLGAQ